MTTLYFAVWETAAEVAAGDVVNEGVVDISAVSVQSTAVMHAAGGNKSRRVRLFADSPCFVNWGADPTALTSGLGGRPLGSENPEYAFINANEKIAVIARTLP